MKTAAQHTPTPLDRTIEILERIEGFFKNNTPVNAGALLDDHTTMADAVRQALFYTRKSVRAVNAHEELVALLKAIRDCGSFENAAQTNLFDCIEQAIALAEGR